MPTLGATPLGYRQLSDAGILGVNLSGTITAATEAQIVLGGRTIILTVTGDTWVTAGAAFDAQRQNIINGLTSAQSELLGWNNTVKLLQGVAGVVRTSNTVVTITLDARASYDISVSEVITATVPATALAGGVALVASPTFTITTGVTAVAAPRHINSKMQAYILAGSGWTPPPPTPGAASGLTQNISLYMTANATTDAYGRSTRGSQFGKLMTASASS